MPITSKEFKGYFQGILESLIESATVEDRELTMQGFWNGDLSTPIKLLEDLGHLDVGGRLSIFEDNS